MEPQEVSASAEQSDSSPGILDGVVKALSQRSNGPRICQSSRDFAYRMYDPA